MNYHHSDLGSSYDILGERLMDWMITMASINPPKAYYICQLLLELGVFIQIGVASSQHELFQVMSGCFSLSVSLICL